MSISIIIPVFNSESSIKKCLESIKNQTYKKVEVIVINDGSTDKSKEVIHNAINGDVRFKLITQSNRGVSAARNAGLDRATGELITFIDSDDCISKNYLEGLLEDYLKYSNVDMVCQGMIKVFDNNKTILKKEKNKIYSSNDLLGLFKDAEITLKGNPVAKLYKSKIIFENNLKFKTQLTYNEDKIFVLKYIYYSKGSIVFSKKCNYEYIITIGSLSNGLLQPDEYWQPYNVFKNLLVDKFQIDYKNEDFLVAYQNFKKYLHMYVNSVFIYKVGNEREFLNRFSKEDWNIYKYISKHKSSTSRKIFDFFLLSNQFKILRLFSKLYLRKKFNC